MERDTGGLAEGWAAFFVETAEGIREANERKWQE
jgi:hypothetical protein